LDVDKQNGINMTIKPIVFDPSMRYISENPSDTFCEYLKRVNSILENDREYMAYVDHFVASMLPHYMNQFSRGGLVHNCFSIGFIKGVAEGLMGRGFFKKEHWINNLQCESHRWAILRAMNNKD
jgi:hypothetical protein